MLSGEIEKTVGRLIEGTEAPSCLTYLYLKVNQLSTVSELITRRTY